MKALSTKGILPALVLALWPGLLYAVTPGAFTIQDQQSTIAAEPPPPKGALVYEDEFSTRKSGLENKPNAADFERGFHAPGVYHLLLKSTDEARWSLLPNASYSTFTIEVDLWNNSQKFAGDVSLGVVFRATDNAHVYAAQIDTHKGMYAVSKLDGEGTWTDLVEWTFLKTPVKADPNRLRVDGEGDKFDVYLNGELLTSLTDNTYARGRLGLFAASVDAPTAHMDFDNLKIYSPEAGTFPRAGQPGDVTLYIALIVAGWLVLLGRRLKAIGFNHHLI